MAGNAQKQCPKCLHFFNNGIRVCRNCQHEFFELKRHPKLSIRGTRNGSAKLTPEKVRAIRQRYQGPRYTASGALAARSNVSALAAEFNIGARHVRAIVDGTVWGWLD